MAPCKKIASLTSAQQQRLAEFRDEWYRTGSLAAPSDRPRAEAAIRAMYTEINEARPEFLWVDGPRAAFMIIALFSPSSLQSSLWSSLESSLRSSLELSLQSSLGSSLESSLRSSLRSSLGSSLWSSYWGGYESSWIAFFRFCAEIGVHYQDQDTRRLNLWSEVAQSTLWWWPYRRLVVAMERPRVCRVDSELRLHADDGPAMAFGDGWMIWALHGARVPEAIVMTPAEELDPKLITTERNAEIRRELVRKIGVERVCEALGAHVVSHQGDYELLLLDLGDGRRRPYLKMRNPSVGIYHIEGVPMGTASVEAALHARKPPRLRALPVRVTGAEWYQQGDVCIWPRAATAVRPRPTVLT